MNGMNLVLTGEPGRDRVLSETQCLALADQLFQLGVPSVRILSYWGGSLRWGRNQVTLTGDRQEVRLHLGSVKTNQYDPATLKAAVEAARRLENTWPLRVGYRSLYSEGAESANTEPKSPESEATDSTTLAASRFDSLQTGDFWYRPDYPNAAIWSEATYQLTPEERGRVVRELVETVETRDLLTAGYIAAEAQTEAVISRTGRHALYGRMTQARYAATVRDRQGTGSGWAGKTSYDWAKIDAHALGERALKKCVDSRNPAALEPGRYTVILEPQAVADLLAILADDGVPLNRPFNERDGKDAPFFLRNRFSKLGLKVADERVTIGQDPLDPHLGSLPFAGRWHGEDDPRDPYRAVNWIENGVLTALWYDRPNYAAKKLPENVGLINRRAFRMKGGPTPIEDMIATTKRGLLVTRLWDVRVRPAERKSVQAAGMTRDGLWLVENGKITKPVKNFRFVESLLFVLNSLEQIGPAEPVFRGGEAWGEQQQHLLLRPAVVPPLKVRDFNFTALVDAV